MKEIDIELGDFVEDRITETEGYVTTIGYHLTGCTRIGVEPAISRGTRGDETFFYEDEVDVTGENYLERFDVDLEPVTNADISIGQRVQDGVTGFEGVVSVINYQLFNCPHIRIQSTGDIEDAEWIDLPRIEVVNEGVEGEYEDLQYYPTGRTGANEDAGQRLTTKYD